MAVTRNNYILVDFENVQLLDVSKLSGLPAKVVLFIGENQKNVSRDLLKQACEHPGVLSVFESIGSGKNALDFQIALHAGIICERDKEAYIHFVSKDKGFDVLVDVLRNQKRFAARANSFDELRLLRVSTIQLPTSVDSQAQLVAAKIEMGTKPRKRGTLESVIKSVLGPEADTSDVISILIRQKFLTIDQNQKVVYSDSPNKSGQPTATSVTSPAGQAARQP